MVTVVERDEKRARSGRGRERRSHEEATAVNLSTCVRLRQQEVDNKAKGASHKNATSLHGQQKKTGCWFQTIDGRMMRPMMRPMIAGG